MESIVLTRGAGIVANGVKSIPMALYNSSSVGVGSRLFGIGRNGLPHGTLNQGTLRAGWGYIQSSNSHVFRFGIGHNPRFYKPTVVFGRQIHYHINVLKVPANF